MASNRTPGGRPGTATIGRRNRRGRALHGLLLLDKPADATSNRVLQEVKRLLDANKAGHTGTLDPLATGMLPILFGEATKLGSYLIDADKAYETTAKLGISTDSLDADGVPTSIRPVPEGLDRATIEAALECFTGLQLQVPPMVSAIRVGGKRLYDLAREGVVIEREPRRVMLHEIRMLALEGDEVTLAVRCSKGTYIRSLVHDLGEALGCGAHVTRLRRSWVAPFIDAPMVTLDALRALAGPAERAALLLPPDAGLGHLGRVRLDPCALADFRQGRIARATLLDAEHVTTAAPEPVLRVLGPDDTLVGLGVAEGGPEMLLVRPLKVLQLDVPQLDGEPPSS